MSADDFTKMIQRVTDPDDLEARALVYEEYIRYMSKGGVNSFHANKIARLLMQGFAIPKVSPK